MKRTVPLLICATALFSCRHAQTDLAPDLVPDSYSSRTAYMEAREHLIDAERALRFDAAVELSADEERANRRLMALKEAELERTGDDFPPAHSYLHAKTKSLIDESPLLEVFQRMPKGGILHAHGLAVGDWRWLIDQAVERADVYVYRGDEGTPGIGPTPGALRYADSPPGQGWASVHELREAAPDKAAFDDELYRSITLGEEDLALPDIWSEFARCFVRASGLFYDAEVYAAFWRKTVHDLVDENVQYYESRSSPESPAVLRQILSEVPELHVTFIPVAGRSSNREQVGAALERALDLRQKDPDWIKGFDLVQEEDTNHTNLFYLEELLEARREAESRGVTLPLYLHSGESNWTSNENLYDAILLETRRIGHGIALFKHPLLMELVKERDIAVEVCPISNQVLGYVADLRNHPAVLYLAAGLPVVLCPDDPGVMRHTFSRDYYEAFMAWDLELKGLKQLVHNSLVYSALSEEEKRRELAVWSERWAEWVAWLNATDL